LFGSFAAPGKTARDPVCFGDEHVLLLVLKSSSVLSRASHKREIGNYKKASSSLVGGYLCCDGSGPGLQFQIRAAPAPGDRGPSVRFDEAALAASSDIGALDTLDSTRAALARSLSMGGARTTSVSVPAAAAAAVTPLQNIQLEMLAVLRAAEHSEERRTVNAPARNLPRIDVGLVSGTDTVELLFVWGQPTGLDTGAGLRRMPCSPLQLHCPPADAHSPLQSVRSAYQLDRIGLPGYVLQVCCNWQPHCVKLIFFLVVFLLLLG
jgi:hypothetical protein